MATVTNSPKEHKVPLRLADTEDTPRTEDQMDNKTNRVATQTLTRTTAFINLNTLVDEDTPSPNATPLLLEEEHMQGLHIVEGTSRPLNAVERGWKRKGEGFTYSADHTIAGPCSTFTCYEEEKGVYLAPAPTPKKYVPMSPREYCAEEMWEDSFQAEMNLESGLDLGVIAQQKRERAAAIEEFMKAWNAAKANRQT